MEKTSTIQEHLTVADILRACRVNMGTRQFLSTIGGDLPPLRRGRGTTYILSSDEEDAFISHAIRIKVDQLTELLHSRVAELRISKQIEINPHPDFRVQVPDESTGSRTTLIEDDEPEKSQMSALLWQIAQSNKRMEILINAFHNSMGASNGLSQ